MADFETSEERYARRQKEQEEWIKQEKLKEQLKFKKMMKVISAAVLGILISIFLC